MKETKNFIDITIVKERDKKDPKLWKYTIIDRKTEKVLDEYSLITNKKGKLK